MSKTIFILCLCFVFIHSQITLLQPNDKNEDPKPISYPKGKKSILYAQTIVAQMNIGPYDSSDLP